MLQRFMSGAKKKNLRFERNVLVSGTGNSERVGSVVKASKYTLLDPKKVLFYQDSRTEDMEVQIRLGPNSNSPAE